MGAPKQTSENKANLTSSRTIHRSQHKNTISSEPQLSQIPTRLEVFTTAYSTSLLSETTTMAQGSGKLSKKTKSSGAQRRKAVKKKSVTKKGRRSYKDLDRTTKSINKKNETLIAAKAMSAGTQFFCSDIKTVGQRENNKQTNQRAKMEKKRTAQRLKQQLQG